MTEQERSLKGDKLELVFSDLIIEVSRPTGLFYIIVLFLNALWEAFIVTLLIFFGLDAWLNWFVTSRNLFWWEDWNDETIWAKWFKDYFA